MSIHSTPESTSIPIVDVILILLMWAGEIMGTVVVLSMGGIFSFIACNITILLGIMNFTIVYPKFKEQIKKYEIWKSLKEFLGR